MTQIKLVERERQRERRSGRRGGERRLAERRGDELPRRHVVRDLSIIKRPLLPAVDALCDTLRVDSGEQRPLDEDEVPDDVSTRELIAAALSEAEFPPASEASTFTLPLAFD